MRKHNFMNKHFISCINRGYELFVDEASVHFPNMDRNHVKMLVSGDFRLFVGIALERHQKGKFTIVSPLPYFDFNSVQSY